MKFICGVSVIFETEVVRGFPVLILKEREEYCRVLVTCLLLACCNSLESLSYVERVGLCASARILSLENKSFKTETK